MYRTQTAAAELKELLDPDIQAVGVFVNETAETVAGLLNRGDASTWRSFTGSEGEDYIRPAADAHRQRPLSRHSRIATVQDVRPRRDQCC